MSLTSQLHDGELGAGVARLPGTEAVAASWPGLVPDIAIRPAGQVSQTTGRPLAARIVRRASRAARTALLQPAGLAGGHRDPRWADATASAWPTHRRSWPRSGPRRCNCGPTLPVIDLGPCRSGVR